MHRFTGRIRRTVNSLAEQVARLTDELELERSLNEQLRTALIDKTRAQIDESAIEAAMRAHLPADAIDLGGEVVLPKAVDWDRWAEGLDEPT